MTIQTTSNLTNSIRAQYEASYAIGALGVRLYDQLATAVSQDMSNIARGSSVVVPFLSHLPVNEKTMSQTADITPRIMGDATATITPTSLADAIQFHEALSMQVFTNYTNEAFNRVGEQMQASVDWIARKAALGGSLTLLPAARTSLDAGTAAHKLTRTSFINAEMFLKSLNITQYETSRGKKWSCITHPWAVADLLADSVILAVGEYQNGDMILNGEIGELHNIKIISDPRAHVFLAGGAANASAIETTLAADASALAKTITVADGSNIGVGDRIMIGTHETSTTLYPTNEWVYVTGIDSTTVSFIGQGENGGLLYDHALGEAVSNDDNVVPSIFGGPESMAKVYQPEVGEYGQIVGPKTTGLADQFNTIAWKWYGGVSIVSGNRILRVENSVGFDA